MATYDVRIFFQDDNLGSELVESGLTLEQVKEICSDPDNSSKTTTLKPGKARTRAYGPWFYGWTESP